MLHNLFNVSPILPMNLKQYYYYNFSSKFLSRLAERRPATVLLTSTSSTQAQNNCSRIYHYYLSPNYSYQQNKLNIIIPKINLCSSCYSSIENKVKQVGQLRLASIGLAHTRLSCVRSSSINSNSWYYYSTSSNNSNNNHNNNSDNHNNPYSQILKSPRKSASSSPLLRSPNNNNTSPTEYSRSVVTSPKIIQMEVDKLQQLQNLSRRLSLEDDPKLLTKEELSDFNSAFNQVVQDLTEIPEMRDMADTNRWLAKVLQFNVPHGKKNRGLAAVLAYKFMAKDLTEENMQLSYIIGWCVEMLQAFFLVADDIMDHSETRRGRLCWYKVDDLGPAAFNDAILLETSIYVLLKKYFRNKDYYVDLLEIFHDATNKTTFGQSLDTRTGLERRMEGYTMELYSAIVKYKTSYYSFTLPVALAMAMARIDDAELRRQATTVTLEMGHFFQIQDDFLDCFGDEQVTGKIGTDIQDCKCSWLFVQALQNATKEQRETLLANYGQQEQSKVDLIKSIYLEMDLEQKYQDFEEQSYNTISSHIIQMSPGLPKSLFLDMLNKIYKRSS